MLPWRIIYRLSLPEASVLRHALGRIAVSTLAAFTRYSRSGITSGQILNQPCKAMHDVYQMLLAGLLPERCNCTRIKDHEGSRIEAWPA